VKLVDFLSYQKALIEDESRFIICMWARQTGKSFALAWKAALDAWEKDLSGQRVLWVVLSRGERQSREIMEKIRLAVRALRAASRVLTGEMQDVESLFRGEDGTVYKQLEVILPGGSRIVGLPANPDTARGFSGNVILDEFAFHQNTRDIWTALYPTITRGYRIVVASTPNGKLNKFYDLWEHGGDRWSRHKVDIYQAVEAGLPVDIDALREGISDPEAWEQEYECKFIDEATAFLSYDLIASCEDYMASLDGTTIGEGTLYMGVDVGRRRDLTVIWLCEQIGDVFWTRLVERMEKTPFRTQRERLFDLLSDYRVRRCCIDATGLGMQLAEEAKERFGVRVEAVTFTNAVKEDLAQRMRAKFEDRLVRIPVDRVIRQDLHSVKKVTTVAGNIRYDAERSEAGGGHADHFWALALALHAGESAPKGRVEYRSIVQRRFAQWAGAW
jgi:phage FluMu gp28-like protein